MAGCDRLTISAELLQKLANEQGEEIRKLSTLTETQTAPAPLTEAQYLWEHNQEPMAIDKLAEGIRNFAIDQNKLEKMIEEPFSSFN